MTILLKEKMDELMDDYQIYLKKSAEKELESLPGNIHDRIVQRLLSLKHDPRAHNAKKLRGREGYRIRVDSVGNRYAFVAFIPLW